MNNMTTQRTLSTIAVEADDRTVLFPAGKFLTHISVLELDGGQIRYEAVFVFNESQDGTEIAVLSTDNAFAFGRAIIDAIYQGRSQHVIADDAKIAVTFNANGFLITFGTGPSAKELFMASPAILRLAHATLKLVDRVERATLN